ncbi:hypothetical protein IQ238_10910 [Pleurocapsales cyanobacterium LEGE 06147]|nr:hypothetical protein [Pleurocapsales cyanobacterium LEGE 06147]
MSDRCLEDLGIPIYISSLGIKAGMLPTPVTVWRLVNLVPKIQPNLIPGWIAGKSTIIGAS